MIRERSPPLQMILQSRKVTSTRNMGRGIMKRTYPRHSRSGVEGPVWRTVALDIPYDYKNIC
jgi:hypothetical protein